ncbi:two-component response regulator ARR14-like [Trifolium pratense]|uniref:two-component response regulator ARR14-like n=1 Tax=Trifolium pratense TaxID=57577 RepID=UPI001E6982E0|nr:two-component response regulator ARR14-like [Trifolium pratense]
MALSIEKDVFPQQFLTNVRVLVIDHDINHLNTIEKMCSQFNYPVKTCSKVSEALNLLMEKKDCFDLVLIEAQMPDMNSNDFLQQVTQQINISVIMMCVDDTISDVKKAIENGACIYWIKPLSENQIKYMWKYVALRIWNEKTKQEIDETFEGECMKTKEKGEKNKDKHDSPMEKLRVVWTPELHKIFVSAVMELDSDNVVPTKILDKMNVPGLTREHVASHLQKFRLYLKEKEKEKQQQIQNHQNDIMKSSFCPNFSHAIQQHNSMSYGCGSSQQVSNELIARNFPYQYLMWRPLSPESNNTSPPQQEHRVNDVDQTSPASVNHQITTTRSLPMSSLTIDANIGDINGKVTRAEETELQIPTIQSLPMSSLAIDANTGDINDNVTRAEETELQIPTTQSLPMSSLTIDANIGDINSKVTRAEETELQIPMTQSLSMSSSTIDANIGDINVNVTRAEGTELDSSLQEVVMKPKEGTILEACESENKVEGTQNVQGMNSVTNNAEMKELRRGMRLRKPNIMLKDYVRE